MSSKTTELPVTQPQPSTLQISPLDQLKNLIDPGAFSIIKPPSKIWIFGGKRFTDKKTTQSSTDTQAAKVLSLRDSFLKKTLSPPVETSKNHASWFQFFDYPESYADDWWAFSGYSDLLEFEHDACYLSRAIILFVESPGALAEFGALAINPYLAPRVFAVIEAKHQDDKELISFINLGPVKRVIDSNGQLCVIDDNTNNELSLSDFNELIKSFHEWTTHPSKLKPFDKNDPTHQMLLISDLIDLFLISKSHDILAALDFLGVKITAGTLLKFCYLLKFLNFIKLEKRGNEIFLLRSRDSEAPWISYKAPSGSSAFNRLNFKIKYSQQWIKKSARLSSVYERVYGSV